MIARDLSVLAHAQGFTLWHYRGAAATPDFFGPAERLFSAGDMVLVSGGAPALLVVERGEGGVRTRALLPVAAGGGSPSGAAPAPMG